MPTTPRSADQKITGLVGTLRCCQLFTGVPGEDLAAIAAFTVVQSLAKDDYLFHEGEPARGFYLVQSGAVNVHRVSAAGKEQVIHVFRAGESFAEASLASPTGYPAHARAVEVSTVLLMPKAPVLELIGRRPDLALRMLGSMSAHLRVLAAELGTSSETLSRTLARLRDQNLISVAARTITVLAAPALAAQLRRNLGEA